MESDGPVHYYERSGNWRSSRGGGWWKFVILLVLAILAIGGVYVATS